MTHAEQMQLEQEQLNHQNKMHFSGAWSSDFLSFDEELELAERNEVLEDLTQPAISEAA